MTEEEAKTKWCPFSRSGIVGDGVANRPQNFTNGAVDDDRSCIGSACMAWRWGAHDLKIKGGRLVSTDDSYCGLAGKP